MTAIHSKDTKPEMVMLRYLRGRGLRSQLNHPRLSGEPDIVMREYWTGYHSIAIMALYLFGNFEQLNLIEEKDMKYTFCPTLLGKYEYPWTNGLSKASVSIMEALAHYYIYARTRGLITFALFEFIARIVLGMGITHGTVSPMEIVFIFFTPRHIT